MQTMMMDKKMTQKQVMFLKVFQLNERKFLNGYSLEFLGRTDLMGGEEEQYYEFYDNEIDNMVNDFNLRSPEFELRQEKFEMKPEDLDNVYVKGLSEMNYSELLRYYKYVMKCDDSEAIGMASMWDEINKASKNDSDGKGSK